MKNENNQIYVPPALDIKSILFFYFCLMGSFFITLYLINSDFSQLVNQTVGRVV